MEKIELRSEDGGDNMIEIKMSGLCEDCRVADLFLDCTEFQSYDMGMSYTSKEWEIKCKHQSACNRMYDQTSREVTE